MAFWICPKQSPCAELPSLLQAPFSSHDGGKEDEAHVSLALLQLCPVTTRTGVWRLPLAGTEINRKPPRHIKVRCQASMVNVHYLVAPGSAARHPRAEPARRVKGARYVGPWGSGLEFCEEMQMRKWMLWQAVANDGFRVVGVYVLKMWRTQLRFFRRVSKDSHEVRFPMFLWVSLSFSQILKDCPQEGCPNQETPRHC